MELPYLINLIGIDEETTTGDVLTKYGEYLGKWILNRDDNGESATLYFIANGESEPLFSEHIGFTDSGMLFGLAMSRLCKSIQEWHAEQDI